MEWDLNNWALDSLLRALQPLRDGDRWRRFFRTPLWLPLPAVAALAFGIIYPMLRMGGAGCAEHALRLGLIATGGTALAWMLGIWAAADPDPGAGFMRKAPPGYESSRWAVWRLRLILVGAVLVVLGVGVWDAVDQIRLEGVPVLLAAAQFLIWVFVVAGVIVPVWLSRKIS